MERAIALGREHGMGCVALANTNHWMRGGTYGWQAVDAGAIGICWTNTMANLPAWGAAEPRVGNNPLVIAVPHARGPVVLDMAMSQFSSGRSRATGCAASTCRSTAASTAKAGSPATRPPSRPRGARCPSATGRARGWR